MEILSHRGFWLNEVERNTAIAFERSFDAGFGTETDLRDQDGEIVVCHDMPIGKQMLFSELLEIMDGRNLTLALNIKSDGLGKKILDVLNKYEHGNYFVFDMSVPELFRQVKDGLPVFTGLSDIQPKPVLLERCRGVWLDSFLSEWFGPETVDELLAIDKQVCIVSAELHGRATEAQWEHVKLAKSLASSNLYLCTDKPLEAQEYFRCD